MNAISEERLRTAERGKRLPRRPPLVCRVCDEPTKDRRNTFCSYECRDAFNMVHSTPYIRMRVFERDTGICAECEINCNQLERRVYGYSSMVKKIYRTEIPMRDYAERKAMAIQLREFGFDARVTITTLWDADHIVALDEGGSFLLDNLQTLCHPCHKKKTAEQVGRKGKLRRLVGVKHLETKKALQRAGLI